MRQAVLGQTRALAIPRPQRRQRLDRVGPRVLCLRRIGHVESTARHGHQLTRRLPRVLRDSQGKDTIN